MPILPGQSGWQMYWGLIRDGAFVDPTFPTALTARYTVVIIGMDGGNITLEDVRMINPVADQVEVSLMDVGTPCVVVHDESENGSLKVYAIGTETILFKDCSSVPPGDSVGTKIVSFFKGLVGKN